MPEIKAPRDAQKRGQNFFIMRNKAVAGSPQPDGRGIQFIFEDGGRLISSAKVVGNITDEAMLKLLETVEGFRKLVKSIGVSVETDDAEEIVTFAFQMYGKTVPYASGTTLLMPVKGNGMEQVIELSEAEWSDDDAVPGQIRFEFEKAGTLAKVSVRFYLQDGFSAPEPEEDAPVDTKTAEYRKMIEGSLMQQGNPARLQRALQRARAGEDVTVAFLGGSITQGAGAIPINRECYAYKTFCGICAMAGRGTEENLHYVKAGVGGTPSEVGMLRYERDVLDEGRVTPDIVVVEFAVNDAGDETEGECFDSLVRKIWNGPGSPAVILLFSVFADDYNLQERLAPVGRAYDLPMVSLKDAVTQQFYKRADEGRVVSKGQYFYDCFHPTNLGHTIMADSLLYMIGRADGMDRAEEPKPLSEIEPPIGGDFEGVKLLDRAHNEAGAEISCGSFSGKTEELQCVERNMDLGTTPEFADNWFRAANGGSEPFAMDICCRDLIFAFLDSGSLEVGKAEVYVDGEKTLTADPHINGWTHCNALICMRNKPGRHHVEVRMAEGDEDKAFTILGFGYVE